MAARRCRWHLPYIFCCNRLWFIAHPQYTTVLRESFVKASRGTVPACVAFFANEVST